MNNKKGFTLIELLVVVLIIGILAAMALPQYFKAVERSRMSEAVTLLGNIAQAEQRKWLQINKFASQFTGLDVAPKGATGSLYYTKGSPSTSNNGNGFGIQLGTTGLTTYNAGSVTATRTAGTGNTLQYQYTLTRYYAGTDVSCTGTNADGAALCADFCGIDSLATSGTCCNNGTSSACAAPAATSN